MVLRYRFSCYVAMVIYEHVRPGRARAYLSVNAGYELVQWGRGGAFYHSMESTAVGTRAAA